MLAQDEFYSAQELGLEDLTQHLYVNTYESEEDGKLLAVLTIQENLEFHRDLDRKYEEDYDARYFTEDDLMSADAEAALKKIVEERYNGQEFILDESGTEYFEFELVLTVDENITPEELGVKFWEDSALIQFFNESDPGTFGSPYLFGSLMSEALGKR